MNILKICQHPAAATSVAGPRYLITTLSFLNLLISCVYLVTNLRLDIDPRANLVQICGSAVTLACLRLSRSHALGAHVFLGMAVLNVCSLVWNFIDFPYTIVMWMPVFTIVSVYLAGLVAGAIWSFIGISSVAALILGGKSLNSAPIPINPTDLPAITVITLYLTGLTAFIGSMFFARSIRDLAQIQKDQNEELRKQNETIQAYAQEKAMLVSIVVHDIATPLTIILHSCDSAQKQSSEAADVMPRIQKAARMIGEISRSVREYQAVESGRTVVDVRPVDLHDVFDRVRFAFEEQLQEKSLQITWNVPDYEELLVLADEESLSNSVINNLISNAIKFSHPGQTIDVTVRTDGSFIELKIRDFGVGMGPVRMDGIFSKKTQSSARGTSGERGSGYGLLIAKAYLDKYKAEIQVESEEQKTNPEQHGTTFTLRLQRAPTRTADHLSHG